MECGLSGAEPRGTVEESPLPTIWSWGGAEPRRRIRVIHSRINHSVTGKSAKLHGRLVRLHPPNFQGALGGRKSHCAVKLWNFWADVPFIGRTRPVEPGNQTCIGLVTVPPPPRLKPGPGELQADEEETSWCVLEGKKKSRVCMPVVLCQPDSPGRHRPHQPPPPSGNAGPAQHSYLRPLPRLNRTGSSFKR